MTAPCALAGTGSSACRWRERILYNERAAHVLQPNALLLFEVVEFGAAVALDKFPDGVRPLCWGFLKCVRAPWNRRGQLIAFPS